MEAATESSYTRFSGPAVQYHARLGLNSAPGDKSMISHAGLRSVLSGDEEERRPSVP
jgi:hypothetical protein